MGAPVVGNGPAWARVAAPPAPPVDCNPNASPPEQCPGGVDCPKCGKPSCPCPTPSPPGPTPPAPPTPPSPPGPSPAPPGAGCTTVTSLVDGTPGSLRDCLSKVTEGQSATVTLAAGVHAVTKGLISLAARAKVSLTGAAGGTTVVDGIGNYDVPVTAKQERERLFFVTNGSTLAVQGITFANFTQGSQDRNENSTLPWAKYDHTGGWAVIAGVGSAITSTNCTFAKCSAAGEYRVKGGVVHIDSGAATFDQCRFVDVDLGWILGMASVAYNTNGALTLSQCNLSASGRPDSGEQQSQKQAQHVWLDGKTANATLNGMVVLKDLRCLGGDDGKKPPYNSSGPTCGGNVPQCQYNCSANQVAIQLTNGATAANIHQG